MKFDHIFITGCGQSGTCLMRDIFMNSNQTLVLKGEGQYHFKGCAPYMPARENRVVVNLKYHQDPANYDWGEIKRRWNAAWQKIAAQKKPMPRTKVEKTPKGVQLLEREKHFENSAFIMVVRNGYVVSECIRRLSAAKADFPWSIQLVARYWANTNKLLLETQKQLKNSIIIKYEDLVAEPASIEKVLRAFTGINDLKIKGVEFTNCVTAEKSQLSLKFNEMSLSELSEQDMEIVEKEAKDMLKRFGYKDRWK